MFKKLNSPPKSIDSFVLSLIVIFLVYNPFYLQGELNIYELELYLSAINGVLNGLVPYKHFFYLRGPFDIYLPAALMSIFGMKVSVLSTFFYVGNVLTLLLSVFIAREILKTRYVLFLLTLILTVKTFPRVVFTYWGGMRYCLGLIAIYFAIMFFKTNKKRWIALASATGVAAFLTSIDVGVAALTAVFLSLLMYFFVNKRNAADNFNFFRFFLIGFLVIAIFFGMFTVQTQSLGDYADMTYTIATRMTTVIDHHSIAETPRNFFEALQAMVNPTSKNFRHLSLAYLYIAFLIYLAVTLKKKEKGEWAALFCLWLYGLFLYLVSFRALWGSNFDMALQPEKILYFFLIERVYVFLLEKKEGLKNAVQKAGVVFIFLALFMSTICFTMARLDKRFYSYQFLKALILGKDLSTLEPLQGEPKRQVYLEKLEGFVLPQEQAEELEGVVNFVKQNTEVWEPVLVYPERGGLYNFLMDRPFVGRFPTVTMSWFNDDWHAEMMGEVRKIKPKYIILPARLQEEKYKVYFSYEPNKEKYLDMAGFIKANYTLTASTLGSRIYERK